MLSLTGAVSLAALSVWGVAVEPRLLARIEQTGQVPGLPGVWHQRRIALFADIQVGIRFGNSGTAGRAARAVVRQRADVVLIAGDFVYGAARDPAHVIDEMLCQLHPLADAGLPTYAVLGNHDYAEESARSYHERQSIADRVGRGLASLNIRVLQNEAIELPAPDTLPTERQVREGSSLYLVGIGDNRSGYEDIGAAFAGLPEGAPRLVLMHDPRSFARIPSGAAPLAFAGHTHGGQIRMPYMRSWNLARLRKRWPDYADGWIENYGETGNKLYVNRGIGCTSLPMRVGCTPELTFFTLVSRERE
jgi:predicted MPP superfamily phosphohydrolase